MFPASQSRIVGRGAAPPACSRSFVGPLEVHPFSNSNRCPAKEHDLMIRPILTGLLGVLSVVSVATIPLACQGGGVGDPCTPEDEYGADFAGFKSSEENIESRSFQCQTRIC